MHHHSGCSYMKVSQIRQHQQLNVLPNLSLLVACVMYLKDLEEDANSGSHKQMIVLLLEMVLTK